MREESSHNFDVTVSPQDQPDDFSIKFDDLLPEPHAASKPCIFLELCAGSAKLSAAVRSTGIPVVPIDHISLYKHYIKHEHLSTSAAAPSGQPTGYQDVGDPPVYDKQMV